MSRIDETNTLCLGGYSGASNTLGAALYIVDFSLSMLKVQRGRVLVLGIPKGGRAQGADSGFWASGRMGSRLYALALVQ